MNGKTKFHSPDGPAFNTGERWIGTSGAVYVIQGRRRYALDKWDVEISYFLEGQPETVWSRDAWHFQVRFTHQADLVL